VLALRRFRVNVLLAEWACPPMRGCLRGEPRATVLTEDCLRPDLLHAIGGTRVCPLIRWPSLTLPAERATAHGQAGIVRSGLTKDKFCRAIGRAAEAVQLVPASPLAELLSDLEHIALGIAEVRPR
jgi:hypothetical protein